jgi:hypothetical protein
MKKRGSNDGIQGILESAEVVSGIQHCPREWMIRQQFMCLVVIVITTVITVVIIIILLLFGFQSLFKHDALSVSF